MTHETISTNHLELPIVETTCCFDEYCMPGMGKLRSFLNHPPFEIGSKIGEEYHVADYIGFGGQFLIVLAKAEDCCDRAVRISQNPNTMLTEEFREFTENQFRYAQKLDHPMVMKSFEYGLEEWGSDFLYQYQFIELVFGPTVEALMSYRESQLSINEILKIVTNAASGIAAIHEQGFLHRDIKPLNMHRSGKILDTAMLLPIGEVEEYSFLKSGCIGTPIYRSPEQMLNQETLSPSSDIYSLTATLFYLLTRAQIPIHTGELIFELHKKFENTKIEDIFFMNGEIPSILNFRDDVPKEIDEFIRKGMAIRREERYQDIESFFSDLKNIFPKFFLY